MSKQYTGVIKIGFPFEIQASVPVDDRMFVTSKTDLYSDTILPYIYPYIEIGVMAESGKKYRWNGLDRTQSANWIPLNDALTSVSMAGNILTYVDENGDSTDIDLSLYLDDTNLSRITGGTYVADGGSGYAVIRFSRDDESTFDVDASAFLDNPFSTTQQDRLMELVYEAMTATLSVSPSSFEQGVTTAVTWSWNVQKKDDTINSATFDGTDISGNLNNNQQFNITATENKTLAVDVVKAGNDKSVPKQSTAIKPQWAGHTADHGTLDGTYAASNAALTKFVSSSDDRDVVVSSVVAGAKVVFLSTKSNATIYDANDFPINTAFGAPTEFTQTLADGTTITLYRYETIEDATLGSYKLR